MAGVGGRTIAEAKQRISYAEAKDWAEFIRRRGSLNVGMRLEHGFGLLAMLINNAHYKESRTQSDFMPHYDQPEATIEYAMKHWE